ncbi:MAG: cupin domain-containing protein [Spirochaetales bacterium]|jgi:quercetin dioxygenase-like cupin family protein|nr:cupin domain-containing protein [Spirochaetales bacterium]
MDELDKGQEVALKGIEAEKAVARAYKQARKWGLTLPDVEPLVLDFGLGDFDKIGEVEFWIANETEAGYCGKYLFLHTGQTCPDHFHKDKLETFYLLKGTLDLVYKDEEIILQQGAVLRVDRGVMHRFTAVEPSLLLEISTPSIIDDNYFKNRHIPIGGNAEKPENR